MQFWYLNTGILAVHLTVKVELFITAVERTERCNIVDVAKRRKKDPNTEGTYIYKRIEI